jgi:hypothetical protein
MFRAALGGVRTKVCDVYAGACRTAEWRSEESRSQCVSFGPPVASIAAAAPRAQDGCPSKAALFVSLTGLVPSAFITQTSKFPLRFESKTILVPSGDQVGTSSDAVLLDSRVRPEPSGFMVTICGLLPYQRVVKAI